MYYLIIVQFRGAANEPNNLKYCHFYRAFTQPVICISLIVYAQKFDKICREKYHQRADQ